MASPSVVAEVIYQKYVNHVPLYRQEQEWKDRDVAFSRTTMANWTIRCAEDWLSPVWKEMRKELLQREVLHADETTVQVLKEKGKAPTTKSYMWLYCTGNDGLPPIVLYDYKTSRSGENARAFLDGFHGHLHTDRRIQQDSRGYPLWLLGASAKKVRGGHATGKQPSVPCTDRQRLL